MSLNAILGAGASGLHTAQTQLRTISDNIANIDTPGYVRKIVDQTPLSTGGVAVERIRLAADRFLQAAGLKAAADTGRTEASAMVWDQAQALFGDPTGGSNFFAGLDRAFAAFSTLAANPASAAARSAAVDQLGQFFSQAQSVGSQLDALSGQADNRIQSAIDQANTLIDRISRLNDQITRAGAGGDATGLEAQQIQLVDQLAGLMDVRTAPRAQGGVLLTGADGFILAGDGDPAVLRYDASGPTGELSATIGAGKPFAFNGRVGSGQLKGLVDLRNVDLPELKTQLSELVTGAAETLNAVHNAHSAAPPPSRLSGVATGQAPATALSGFTGRTTVMIADQAGVVQRKVEIDFDAMTMRADGGAATPFTGAGFASSLTTALGGFGSAAFSADGALTLSAAGANGVAVADDPAAPALKAGRGFSGFFGLNDLVVASRPYEDRTGLTAASPHGFPAGQSLAFRISGADGARISDVSVTVPAGGTMGDLVSALNQPVGGVGLYGSFALDGQGRLAFTPSRGESLSVARDGTSRTTDGAPLSVVFGIGGAARAARTGGFAIRADILSGSGALATAQADPSAAVGARALSAGDARGADALAQAGQKLHGFAAAGGTGAGVQSLTDYATGLAGQIARRAEAAEARRDNAAAVAAEASARRSSVEGVNLDQELIAMTTYQQAYNASARLIQAAKEMYDVLLNLVD